MKNIYYVFALLLMAIGLGSCSNEMENIEEAKGYIQLEMETITSTNTRASVMDAPSNYDSKTLLVRILNAQNQVIKETTWKDGTFASSEFASPIMLTPGTYTVEAHSANWDGTGSGWNAPFYAGTAAVTVTAGHLAKAKLKLTQDNVKVEVIWDPSFKDNFTSAKATISMENNDEVSSRAFNMTGTSNGAAYFPVGNLEWQLTATNKRGIRNDMSDVIRDVKARDYLRINFSVAESGTGSINIYLDETTRTYSISINVPRESTVSLNANRITESVAAAAAVGGSSAILSGTAAGKDLDKDKLFMQYREKGAEDWTIVDNAALVAANAISEVSGGVEVSYNVTGLKASTQYEYQLAQDGSPVVTSNIITFTIEGEALYNGGFELWHQDGNVWYANASGTTYWDSSNPGSASMGAQYNVTTRGTDKVHGGSSAAKLASRYIIIKFAAASLYTGAFDHLVGTNGAVLNWGVPFTSRPASLHGFFQYAPGSINRGTQPNGAPAKGDPDQCQIYCALTTEAITVDNTNIEGTFPNWQTDKRVVAYGTLPVSECVSTDGNWKDFDIPFEYHDLNKLPTHLIIVASSSKYGDYFYGSDQSVLYLDDFELRY